MGTSEKASPTKGLFLDAVDQGVAGDGILACADLGMHRGIALTCTVVVYQKIVDPEDPFMRENQGGDTFGQRTVGSRSQ
jgi:hypothetical protein